MLGLLRHGDEADGPTPQPNLSQLPALVRQLESAGMPVSVSTTGDLAGLPQSVSGIAGFAAAFAVHGGALRFGWSFPAYKSRPGRRPEDIP